MAKYNVNIDNSRFGTITPGGGNASYTVNGQTGTLSDFSWTGQFTIPVPNPFGGFEAGDYVFSGGTGRSGSYHRNVSVQTGKRQDQAKTWTASEG